MTESEEQEMWGEITFLVTTYGIQPEEELTENGRRLKRRIRTNIRYLAERLFGELPPGSAVTDHENPKEQEL